jgi:hypothetical protein
MEISQKQKKQMKKVSSNKRPLTSIKEQMVRTLSPRGYVPSYKPKVSPRPVATPRQVVSPSPRPRIASPNLRPVTPKLKKKAKDQKTPKKLKNAPS